MGGKTQKRNRGTYISKACFGGHLGLALFSWLGFAGGGWFLVGLGLVLVGFFLLSLSA